MKTTNPAIDTTIVDFLLACEPATFSEIYSECILQCSIRPTKYDVMETVDRLMKTGYIGWYDNCLSEMAYEIRSGEL